MSYTPRRQGLRCPGRAQRPSSGTSLRAAQGAVKGDPEGQTIQIDSRGDWDLPVGSVVLKHFRLHCKLIETRVLIRLPESGWTGYTYEWRDSQDDASLLTTGKRKKTGGQTWTFPSREQCLDCHTDAAGGTLGLETLQMNRDFTCPTKRTRN